MQTSFFGVLFLFGVVFAYPDGTSLELVECSTNASDVAYQFTTPYTTDNTIHVLADNKCLDILAYGTTVGSVVQVFTCHTSDKDPTHQNQEWSYDGAFIKAQMSQLCIGPSAPSKGVGIQLTSCDVNAKWSYNTTLHRYVHTATGMCLKVGNPKRSPLCTTLPCSHACLLPNTTNLPFCQTNLPIEDRVENILSMLTLQDKIKLLGANPDYNTCDFIDAGVARLGIPPFMWLTETNTGAASECLAPGKCATTFASPAGLAASFNRTAWRLKGDVISTEMRAYNNIGWHRAAPAGPGENNYFIGVSGFGPNINIVRDPRYGRNCEVPSEDPLLSGTYAAHMLRGMQEGEDPRYLKMMAFVKHYTAYSVEANRMAFNGVINDFDMWDTYLAQYKIAFIEGRASGAMCSYASINGIPSCGNPFLMNDVVRTRWERPDTLFTSDCDAVANMADANHYATNYTTAVAYAINAGMDLNTGATYTNNLGPAVAMGFTNETTITAAVRRTLMMKMRTGMFDPLENQVYTTYDERNVSSERNQFINFDTVSQSFVLLKNANNTLPLQRGQKVAVVGPHAVSTRGLLEDYAGDRICYGYPGPNYDCIQTLGEGIANLNGAITAVAEGVSVSGSDTSKIAAALAAARSADVVVLCLGLDTMSVEHEGQDRSTINLPGIQEQFAQQIFALGKPTVLVLVNGGAIAIDNLIQQSHAIVEAFYPSTSGAAALANSLFGLSNRWGKLPFTIYPNNYINQVQMNDMSMTNGAGRTYRYYSGTPLFPFGVGLSYSSFNIDPCVVHNNYHVQCNVCLVGGASTGDEVVLVYHQVSDAIRANVSRIHPVPAKQLIDFERFTFTSIGECQRATFKFKVDQFGITDSKGSKVLYPGDHNIIVTNGNDQTQVLSFTF